MKWCRLIQERIGQEDIKDGEREEDIVVSVEAEFVLMEEEVLSSLFFLDFIFYSKQYIYYSLSSLNQTVITKIWFDESAISVKLSNGVRFEGLKVYFPKIKN